MPFRKSLILALLLASCSAPEPAPRTPVGNQAVPAQEAPPPDSSPAPADLVQGQTRFALDLYRRLDPASANLFFSPVSISTALGMVYAGAEAETAAEMAQALRYPVGDIHDDMERLLRRLELDGEGRKLSVANALWVQQDFVLRPAFTELARRRYDGVAQQVDFVGNPQGAVATVNRWGEEQTNGRIKGLLTPENITPLTRLILTNAVYFNGDWLRPFPKSGTRSRPFYLDATRSVTVPFMRQRGGFRVIDEQGFKAVELPYKGEELSMMLFLPSERNGLPAFEASLTAERLAAWIDALRAARARDMELVVPKLELNLRSSLVPELRALGMRRAFERTAQLGGIADQPLRLSDVIHQTYLRVDEKGTEAAAATAAIAEIVSVPWPFHADHPFFFVIRDNRSGSIVFMGRIRNPAAR